VETGIEFQHEAFWLHSQINTCAALLIIILVTVGICPKPIINLVDFIWQRCVRSVGVVLHVNKAEPIAANYSQLQHNVTFYDMEE
jgi:hypothetical protein